MLTVEEALTAVTLRATSLPPTRLPLAQALGCVLAEDVAADLDSPPFRKALVDGYAVRVADVGEHGHRLAMGEAISAGKMPTRPLALGEAALVMTGAPMPEGADAIVMREVVDLSAPGFVKLDPATSFSGGRNWMPQGREMRAGEVVLRRGESLTPARIGLLATVGKALATVIPRPRVAVVPTGDELVEPGCVPGPGQIRNSNAAMLRAFAESWGAEAWTLPIAPDEPEALRAILARGLETANILLVAGGVSEGDRDLVPAALVALGVEPVFHKVRLKPGKPLWFGVGQGPGARPLVFGLPGNPVGALVGALLFVRPALDILRGFPGRPSGQFSGRLAAPFEHRGARPTYHPAHLHVDGENSPRVEPLEWAGSADLRRVALADGFAVFPAGDRAYREGEPVEFLPLGAGH